MKIAYVAGFFTPVLAGLQNRIPEQLETKAVIWIPQFSNGDLDINRFKSSFYDVIAQGATHVLICLFLFRNKLYLREVIQAIIDDGVKRSPDIDVKVEMFKDAQDIKQKVLSKISDFNPSSEHPFPDSLDGLEQWISEQHNGKVLLHPRAADAVKKSQYHDVRLIYAAIDALGKEYWSMRTASAEDAASRCTSKLQRLSLELSPSISPSRAGEQGQDYFVFYPLGLRKKDFLSIISRKALIVKKDSACGYISSGMKTCKWWSSDLFRRILILDPVDSVCY